MLALLGVVAAVVTEEVVVDMEEVVVTVVVVTAVVILESSMAGFYKMMTSKYCCTCINLNLYLKEKKHGLCSCQPFGEAALRQDKCKATIVLIYSERVGYSSSY